MGRCLSTSVSAAYCLIGIIILAAPISGYYAERQILRFDWKGKLLWQAGNINTNASKKVATYLSIIVPKLGADTPNDRYY
jgi:hypothetical protein